MSLQLLGFGLAGIMRRFLVKPVAMFWPGCLSQIAMFVGFHEKVDENQPFSKYRMSRYKFFWLAAVGFFVYTWIPEFFIPVLQGVALLCIISKNRILNFLGSFSQSKGPGIGAITFDLAIVGSGSLVVPFYASVQAALSAMYFLIML